MKLGQYQFLERDETMATLENALRLLTRPDEGQAWTQSDCVVRLLDNRTVTIRYPDGSETVLVRKHGEWLDGPSVVPTAYGLP